MQKKPAIKTKLKEAEEMLETSTGIETDRLAAVVVTLRWVLDLKIMSDPKSPV